MSDGHLTKEPTETVYSGVVSLRMLRLAMFLSELNNLQLWGADVENAYLLALTKKLYIVASTEFEELQGHVLVMYKVTGFDPSPKSFWSCTHVNSCQNYTLYINLHILLNILCKATSNIQKSRKVIE